MKNIEKTPNSESLSPEVEDAVREAAEMFRGDSKKTLSQHGADFGLSREAEILRRLREAAIKFMKEKPGRIPDKVDLWDMVKNAPKLDEKAAEIEETGGGIYSP